MTDETHPIRAHTATYRLLVDFGVLLVLFDGREFDV